MLVTVVATASACGQPAHLDAQEQVAFARECTSLIERNLSDNDPPREGVLGRETLNLDDPKSFYDTLERLRGPHTYDLHDPAHRADTARQPLDNCNVTSPVLSSLFSPGAGSRSSTTTTTTTTTAPGT